MAFGSGFLQGMQVGQSFKHNQELMDQRQEDRDRESYDRDLSALIADLRATRGDRTQEEFAESDDIAALISRHKGGAVFDKIMDKYSPPGKRRKLRDIVENKNKRNVVMVDVYDRQGKSISKDRPVTNKGDSREANPNDLVSQFSRTDLYELMMGEVVQSASYVDMNARANRMDALLDSTQPGLEAPSTPKAPAAPSAGLAAPITESFTAPGATPLPVEAQGDVQSAPLVAAEDDVRDEDFEDRTRAEQRADDDFQPIVDGPRARPGDASTRYDALLAEEEAAAQPSPEEALAQLTAQKEQVNVSLKELTDVSVREKGMMSMQQRGKARGEMKKLLKQSQDLGAQIDEMTGESTATRVGRAVGNIPGAVGDAVSSAAEGITQHPVVKGASEAVSDFWGGLTGDETPTPVPEGTKKSEEFGAGLEAQANNAVSGNGSFDDYLNGTSSLRTQTKSQKDKIADVNQDTTTTVNAGNKLTRKQLTAWRKANRAQVIYGDKTASQGIKDYYALLERNKRPAGDYSMSFDAKTGIAVILNKETGGTKARQLTPGTGPDKGDELKEIKLMHTIADTITGGDDPFGKNELIGLIDRSRNTIGFSLAQPGAHDAIDTTYSMWKGAVDNATTMFGLQWLGTTPGEAKQQNPSMTPFFSAAILSVNDTQVAVDFAKELAVINGEQVLSEAHWVDVQKKGQALAKKGIVGKPAMKMIADWYRLKGVGAE